MADIPQKIFSEISVQARPDGKGGLVYYHHAIFGMAEINGSRQSLKKDAQYLWVSTQADGRKDSRAADSLVSEDGLTVGRQVWLTNPSANQVVLWELWEMPQAAVRP